MLLTTKGRVRQKVKTLARIAGLQQSLDVVFSQKEALARMPEYGGKWPWRKSVCTKKDTALARAFTDRNFIWVDMPVALRTLEHEVAHFLTTASHTSNSFLQKVVILGRGKNPAKNKPQWYEVTVVRNTKYRVYELSANEAKKHCYSNEIIESSERITAHKVK